MAKNINIRDRDVVALINARAEAEGRTAQNAANQTIREALIPIYGPKRNSFKQSIIEKSIRNGTDD